MYSFKQLSRKYSNYDYAGKALKGISKSVEELKQWSDLIVVSLSVSSNKFLT